MFFNVPWEKKKKKLLLIFTVFLSCARHWYKKFAWIILYNYMNFFLYELYEYFLFFFIWIFFIWKQSFWGFLFEFYWIVNWLRGELTCILLLNFPIFENGLSIYSGLMFLKGIVKNWRHSKYWETFSLSLFKLSCFQGDMIQNWLTE